MARGGGGGGSDAVFDGPYLFSDHVCKFSFPVLVVMLKQFYLFQNSLRKLNAPCDTSPQIQAKTIPNFRPKWDENHPTQSRGANARTLPPTTGRKGLKQSVLFSISVARGLIWRRASAISGLARFGEISLHPYFTYKNIFVHMVSNLCL